MKNIEIDKSEIHSTDIRDLTNHWAKLEEESFKWHLFDHDSGPTIYNIEVFLKIIAPIARYIGAIGVINSEFTQCWKYPVDQGNAKADSEMSGEDGFNYFV